MTTDRLNVDVVELGEQYIAACLEFVTILDALIEATPSMRVNGVDGYHLPRGLQSQAGTVPKPDWAAESKLLPRRAVRDLGHPLVGVIEAGDAMRSPRLTGFGRTVARDPEQLFRNIGRRLLEPFQARTLRVVADQSFVDRAPAYVPRDEARIGPLTQQLIRSDDDQYQFEIKVDTAIRELAELGLVTGKPYLGDPVIRVSLAGLVWLAHHDRVVADIAREEERVQVTINNQHGTIHAISTGSGPIHQIISSPVVPGDWESLRQTLLTLQVSTSRIDELAAILDTSERERQPNWLKRWADASITEMAGNLGAAMVLAAGSDGAQQLIQLVNAYRG